MRLRGPGGEGIGEPAERGRDEGKQAVWRWKVIGEPAVWRWKVIGDPA